MAHGETKRPSALNDIKLRPRLKLPSNSDKKKWKNLDEQSGEKGELQTFCRASMFGTIESKVQSNPAQGERKRQPRLLRKLKAAKTTARKEFRRVKRVGGDSRQAHARFMKAVRAHHDLLKGLRRKDRENQKTRECKKFLSDPHKYAKNLLNPPNELKPAFDKKTADDYFKHTYQDAARDFHYQPPAGVPRPELPSHAFNLDFFGFDAFSAMCWKKSNGSAPSVNGVPYLIYKRCEETRRLLWSLLKRIWVERCIPVDFQVGRIRLLAKGGDTNHPKLMRPISVLNSEGRLFWTVFQMKLSRYMLDNKYIQLRVQKGFLEGVVGCIELTSVHSDAR